MRINNEVKSDVIVSAQMAHGFAILSMRHLRSAIAPLTTTYRCVSKSLKAAPLEVQKRYEKWKDIVSISGPQSLRLINGLNDEALSGK